MKIWIIINDNREGPFTLDELRTKSISPDTPVWSSGMVDWMAASEAPVTADLFREPSLQPSPAESASEPAAVTPPQPEAAQQHYYYSYNQASAGQKVPPTYLVWAILSTLCCCLIPGIVAIVLACQTRTLINRGDIDGARRKSRTTAWWIIISFTLGLMTLPLVTIFYGVPFL